MPKKSELDYFHFGRKKSKKSKKKGAGEPGGKKHDIFDGFVGLSIFLVVYLSIMLIFQDTIDAVPLFHILMTLGGQLSYENTVFGSTILFMIFGIILILDE